MAINDLLVGIKNVPNKLKRGISYIALGTALAFGPVAGPVAISTVASSSVGCGDEEGCKTDSDCATEAGRYCIDGVCQADGNGDASCESMCQHIVYDCDGSGYDRERCIEQTPYGDNPETNCPSEFDYCVEECYDGHYNYEFRSCLATTECESAEETCSELYTGE